MNRHSTRGIVLSVSIIMKRRRYTETARNRPIDDYQLSVIVRRTLVLSTVFLTLVLTGGEPFEADEIVKPVD